MNDLRKDVTITTKEKIIKPKVYGRYVIISLKEMS